MRRNRETTTDVVIRCRLGRPLPRYWLRENLDPQGVGVVIEAEHSCMTTRGVRASGATTVTSALLAAMRSDSRSRAEFLALTTGPPNGKGVRRG